MLRARLTTPLAASRRRRRRGAADHGLWLRRRAAVSVRAVDPAAPIVVATTSIWADITANVACDGLAEIETIIPPGGDPHSFEPSLRDRETMDNADLVVANGLFLEESLDDTIDAVESNGVPVLRVADELDPIPRPPATTTTATITTTRTATDGRRSRRPRPRRHRSARLVGPDPHRRRRPADRRRTR